MPSDTPLALRRPALTPDDAAQLARDFYGIDGRAHELPSERDRNFRITALDESVTLLLKVAQAGEDPALVDAQAEMLRLAAQHDDALPTPRTRLTLDGRPRTEAALADGRTHIVRALSWLEGTPMAEVCPQRPALLRQVGDVIGRLDQALADFDHPALHRELAWDLARAPTVLPPLATAIRDDSRRARFEICLARFLSEHAPRFGTLRQGVVHGDANDYNLLVTETLNGAHLTGLLDFGDAHHGLLLGEPAVACAYAMMGKRDPLAAAANVIRGYHAACPIPANELDVLEGLILARLLTTVGMAAHQRAQDPSNAYLSVSEEAAWGLLDQLAETPPRLITAVVRDACGLEPVATAERVREWLATHEDIVVPCIEGAEGTDAYVHDLSVASEELAGLERFDHEPSLTARLDASRAAAGVTWGLGRYDEPRLLYTADGFLAAAEDRDEPRTIHLGVDVFGPAGSPVRAPLDGVIHWVADNDRALDYGPTLLLRHEPVPGLEFFTLYGHLARTALDQKVGTMVAAGDVIAHFGEAHENGGWPPHLHLQLVTDLLGLEGDFPGVARPGQRPLFRSLCPDPTALLGRRESLRWQGTDALQTRRRARLGPSLGLSYRMPLTIVRGRGVHLFDEEGRAYLDAVNNVPHVGHQHPHVVRAGQRQMAVLNTNTRYLHERIVRYAERLAARFPAPLDTVFLVCSGSEANELALRIARVATGRRDVLALDGGYHGNTGALVDLSSYKHDGPGGAGAPEWVHIAPMPDPYRGRHRGPDSGAAYAADLETTLRAAGADRVAAFLAEPLLGCGGQIVPPEGFFTAAYDAVRRAGGLCIADEVQVGFGRVGSHDWAFELHGVVPDLVTLGKPIGNGHPLGAVVTTRTLAEAFANGMEYFNTFGGNPVSCAIGEAVLDVLDDEQLREHARDVGAHLLGRLQELATRHVWIGDVRGRGLYVGAELVHDRATRTPAPDVASAVVERMKDRGFLLSTDGPDHNVLKMKPPLPFSKSDADRLCDALDATFSETILARHS